MHQLATPAHTHTAAFPRLPPSPLLNHTPTAPTLHSTPSHHRTCNCTHAQHVRQPNVPDGAPIPGRLPKPDVVLASYEGVVSDLPLLKAVAWEAMVVDFRHRCVCVYSCVCACVCVFVCVRVGGLCSSMVMSGSWCMFCFVVSVSWGERCVGLFHPCHLLWRLLHSSLLAPPCDLHAHGPPMRRPPVSTRQRARPCLRLYVDVC